MRSDKYKATSGKSLKIGKRELALTPKNIIKIILLVILALIVATVIYAVVCIATAPKIDTSSEREESRYRILRSEPREREIRRSSGKPCQRLCCTRG